jgi:hypothetical protein
MTESLSLPTADRVRCSDADRERTCEILRNAAGEGRLMMDELEERVVGVYATRYCDELDTFVADLPTVVAPTPSGWLTLLRGVMAQLGADLALLFGRDVTGWTKRRVVIAVTAAAIVALVVIAAIHGFDGGIDGHGIEGPGER